METLHEIVVPSEKQRKKAGKKLESFDTYGLLNNRFSFLREVLATVKAQRKKIRDLLLVECGGYPHNHPTDRTVANPEVSHFLSLHGKEMGIEFLSFDRSFSSGELKRNFDSANEEERKPTIFRKHPELSNILVDAIQRCSIRQYSDLLAAIDGREAVLFSHHTLNDPGLEHKAPFWKIQGLHLHTGFFSEICAGILERMHRKNGSACPTRHKTSSLYL